MTKFQLTQALAQKEGLPLNIAKGLVDTVFESISESLVAGDRVEIRGFGSFKVKHYDGYYGRNPKTGEKIAVDSKKLPVFKAGKALKELVND